MKLIFNIFTLWTIISFFITASILIISYYQHTQRLKKVFFIFLLITATSFAIWGLLRNFYPPFWA